MLTPTQKLVIFCVCFLVGALAAHIVVNPLLIRRVNAKKEARNDA